MYSQSIPAMMMNIAKTAMTSVAMSFRPEKVLSFSSAKHCHTESQDDPYSALVRN